VTSHQEIKIEQTTLQSNWLNKVIIAKAGYFNGRLHKFVLDNGRITLRFALPKEPVPKIIIVSRSYYHEQLKNYPIESAKELKKLLALEHASNDTKFKILGTDNGQTSVNCWQFHADVPPAMIQLPESLILAQLSKGDHLLSVTKDMEDDQKPLFVANVQRTILSTNQSSVINSVERFALSTGLASDIEQHQINSNDYAAALIQGLSKLNWQHLASFFNRGDGGELGSIFAKLAIPASLVLICYLALSSGYLAYHNSSLSEQLISQKQQINGALNQQQQFDSNIGRYQALGEFFSTQQTSSSIWLVMASLLPEIKTTNIRMANNRFVIRGTAPKATDALELINNHPLVIAAKFDSPTRTRRGRESFVIGLTIRAQALDETPKPSEDAAITQTDKEQGHE